MRGRVAQPKTRKGKLFLENRAPKVHENDKNAILVKGGKTSKTVTDILQELYKLKKPLATHLKRHNPFHPFEDASGLEYFSTKYDSSLFLFGSNSKKRPNSLTFGRTFDSNLLDMVEMQVENYVPSLEFKEGLRPVLGTKPCITMQGELFESDPTMTRVGNLMIDWFRGVKVNQVRLQGLELIISLTAQPDKILFRVYRTNLKKSATSTPRVELTEIGPSIDFKINRHKLASDSLFKTATRQPGQLRVKPRKNVTQDVFGSTLGRIHVGRQNVDALQTRKMKGLRKPREDGHEEEHEDAQEDGGEEMEE
uniref:Ribosome production factor 2 homolog n=1 Tax=Steinernema glaseri TaxID=37863 RepID=A0A1I7YJK9_9BILA